MAITTKKTEEKIQRELEKMKETVGEVLEAELSAQKGIGAVKQLIRWISKQNVTSPDMEFDRVQDIDTELAAYYDLGYKLFATHYLGQNPEAFGVLYILTK